MTTTTLYRIDRLSVVDVGGQDASAILHNLTTNAVTDLIDGQGRETFLTDVRGKTLAHVGLYRGRDGIRLIGPTGPSEVIVGHIDRYTIREDATPSVADDRWMAVVISGGSPLNEVIEELGGWPDPDQPTGILPWGEWKWNQFSGEAYRTRWLGDPTDVILVDPTSADSFVESLAESLGAVVADESQFHLDRTKAGFPWHGIDLTESNLPQEADRDAVAISFTKGCYLGQETVARLDALGQVQKKLVRWRVEGAVPPAGTELMAGEKLVGRLTSVAPDRDGATAIGMARRSHFDPGSSATGTIPGQDQPFTATVQ